jgi:hypothetical protein
MGEWFCRALESLGAWGSVGSGAIGGMGEWEKGCIAGQIEDLKEE